MLHKQQQASSRATVSERSSKGASAMRESFSESPSVTMTSKHRLLHRSNFVLF